ncbi:MAG: HAMP domain-containing sensor histidine kinase [Clostridiales bacterium]|nr:HAMP domain-containing sensor histidine kinase [Clostridiales bacterium]
MIQKIRKRFLILFITLMGLFLTTILVTINVAHYHTNLTRSRRILSQNISKYGLDAFCMDPAPSATEDIFYCSVLIPEDSGNSVILINRIDGLSDQKAVKLAEKHHQMEFTWSLLPSYSCISRHSSQGNIVILMDNSFALENSASLLYLSLLLEGIGLVILYLFACYLAQWLFGPVIRAYDSQKQFIANASHELKTPLTIIRSNVSLLEKQMGNQTQIRYIRQETERMTTLLNEMLTLLRMDTSSARENFTTFSLTDAWLEILLPFDAVAYEQNCTLDIHVDDSISFFGNVNQMQQLISILMDNALRYTSSGGTITVTAFVQHKKIKLSVKNTGEPIPPELCEKIFERFYQSDESHSDSGHFGLGLSIARAITENYSGSIHALSLPDGTEFSVVLPQTEVSDKR